MTSDNIIPLRDDRLTYLCSDKDEGRQIGRILSDTMKISRGMIHVLKQNQGIYLNGIPARTVDTVSGGDEVKLLLNCRQDAPKAAPEEIPIRILYEDGAIIAVDKPPGMVLHTTTAHRTGTLANALAYYMLQNKISGPIHPVSRLDKDTSGIVLFARNGYVQEALKRQGENGTFKKKYLGLVCPAPQQDSGRISLPIARMPGSIITRTISQDGAFAVTDYCVKKSFKNFDAALVEFILHTGRTHQIRVHTLFSGFPLLGDSLYTPNSTELHGFPNVNISVPREYIPLRQALHAYYTEFIHPVTGKMHRITASLPEDMRTCLQKLHDI